MRYLEYKRVCFNYLSWKKVIEMNPFVHKCIAFPHFVANEFS